MPLPHVFAPNTPAMAEEVNANFTYVMSIIGADSDPDDWKTRGALRFGPGYGSALVGLHANHAHLTWNAEEVPGLKFRRYAAKKGATVVRAGAAGFSILTTNKEAGDLTAQLEEVFAIRHVANGTPYLAIPNRFHIRSDQPTDRGWIQHRLTYVPFYEPITLYENVALGQGSRTHNVYQKGVPRDAIAIQVMLYATATTWSGAALILAQARKERHRKYGIAANAYGGDAANYGRTTVTGTVNLGIGAYAGQVYEERTASLSEASCWVQGYWV